MPKFKIGDRVKYTGDKKGFGNDSLKGEIGTIVFMNKDKTPLIEFDNMTNGYEGQGFGFKGKKEVKKGSCYWCHKSNLELIKPKTRNLTKPPQIFYRKNILQRFMTREDIKYLDKQYQKHKKKGSRTLNTTKLKIKPEDLKYYKQLGKTMTIDDIAQKINRTRQTARRRMGEVALLKLKKI